MQFLVEGRAVQELHQVAQSRVSRKGFWRRLMQARPRPEVGKEAWRRQRKDFQAERISHAKS